jgi:hypothetical protein
MAGFFLYNKKTELDQQEIILHFAKINITRYNSFCLDEFSLIVFQKELVTKQNYIDKKSFQLFAVGSFVYKSLSYQEGLEVLLDDFINNNIDYNLLRGIYTIIIYNKKTKQISVIIDPTFSKHIYIDQQDSIISSHILPVYKAKHGHYKINKLAIYESVITGSLIPPDTYFTGIERICSINISSINKLSSIISFLKHEPHYKPYNNRKVAITTSNELIDNYFRSLKSLDREFGSHIGLTGGFDSRLLLIHALNNLNHLNANSFFRKGSSEYQIAKDLAKKADIEFKTHESPKYTDKLYKDPKLVLNYLDGQIRSQNYINEPFLNPSYFKFLYKNKLIGFHGCGGEQYRNADRLNRTNLMQYILNEWLKDNSDKLFHDSKLKYEIIDYIYYKIKRTLNLHNDNLRLIDIKRIQNEIWNPANRLTRVNALNQSLFYFAPFTEWQLSFNSYSIVPFLKRNNNFQIEMMSCLKSNLNSITTTHGYSIDEGISQKERIINFISLLIPRYLSIAAFKMLKHNNNQSVEMTEVNDFTKVFNLKSHRYSYELAENINSLEALYNLLNN